MKRVLFAILVTIILVCSCSNEGGEFWKKDYLAISNKSGYTILYSFSSSDPSSMRRMDKDVSVILGHVEQGETFTLYAYIVYGKTKIIEGGYLKDVERVSSVFSTTGTITSHETVFLVNKDMTISVEHNEGQS